MTKFSYVCFTKDDFYVDLLNILMESIELYSEYDLYVYLIDFNKDSLKKIKHIDNSKFKIINYQENKNCISMFNYKAHILTDFIINGYSDYGCYLDIDCVITPHCDDIFNNIDLVSGNVPISSIHPDDINEENIIMKNLLKFYNVKKSCHFVHNDLILFSKNSLKFMYEWSLMCVESNSITIWDEYLYNVLLWKYKVNDQHYLEIHDCYYELFNTCPKTRYSTFIYHGCKDIDRLSVVFSNIKDFYSIHPLTVYKSPFQKIRLGKDNDGGYIIADIPDAKYDIFISAGIGDDHSFETDFVKKYKTSCVMFDNTINKIENCDLSHIQKNISDVNTNSTTNLKEYFSTYNNIFMKMDIEGGEENLFKVITQNDLQKIKQLVIEIHDCHSIIPSILSKTHYLIHIHGNNYGGVPIINNIPIPNVFELTYVRKDCFEKKPKLNTELLPLDIDQKCGVYHEDGIHERSDIILHCKPYVNCYLQHPYVRHAYGWYNLDNIYYK